MNHSRFLEGGQHLWEEQAREGLDFHHSWKCSAQRAEWDPQFTVGPEEFTSSISASTLWVPRHSQYLDGNLQESEISPWTFPLRLCPCCREQTPTPTLHPALWCYSVFFLFALSCKWSCEASEPVCCLLQAWDPISSVLPVSSSSSPPLIRIHQSQRAEVS